MFETGVVRANKRQSDCRVTRHTRDIFSIFYNKKVYSVFSLESPNRCDSNGYTQYTIFNKKIALNYPKSAAIGFSKGLNNEFETAVVSELSVFEPLKFYCSHDTIPVLLFVFPSSFHLFVFLVNRYMLFWLIWVKPSALSKCPNAMIGFAKQDTSRRFQISLRIRAV